MRSVAIALSVLFAAATAAQACGVCVDDKVAATYDHRTVQDALARRKVVVYCELVGVRDVRIARQAAARVRGVDAQSVRVSSEPAALSFVLDPKQHSAEAAVLALQAALPPGTRVSMLKVHGAAIGSPASPTDQAAPRRGS